MKKNNNVIITKIDGDYTANEVKDAINFVEENSKQEMIEKLKEENKQLKLKFNNLEQENISLKEENESLEIEKNDLEAAISTLREETDKLENENQRFKDELKDYNIK